VQVILIKGTIIDIELVEAVLPSAHDQPPKVELEFGVAVIVTAIPALRELLQEPPSVPPPAPSDTQDRVAIISTPLI
jgi:hypothetical protein